MSSTSPHLINAEDRWPGLSAYDEASQDFFKGRDKETADLFRMVGMAPLTMLFGKSGLGKTSLLLAALFPRLRQQNILPVYVRLNLQDPPDPLIEQARIALNGQLEEHCQKSRASTTEESLWEMLHRNDNDWRSKENDQPLIPLFVFDQFEEVFTLGARRQEAVHRLRLDLADLIENRIPRHLDRRIAAGESIEHLDLRGQRYKVLLSLREDFLADVECWKQNLPSLMRNRLRLLPMSADVALQVARVESKKGKDDGLMDEETAIKIISFLGKEQAEDDTTGRVRQPPDSPEFDGKKPQEWDGLKIEPALLSLMLNRLNEDRKNRQHNKITSEDLDDKGNTIIVDFYEECLKDRDQSRRFIEDKLITESGYRTRYPKKEALSKNLLTPEELDRLLNLRVLRIEQQGRVEWIELIHDRLTEVVRKSRDKRFAKNKRKRLYSWVAVGLALVLALISYLAVLNYQSYLAVLNYQALENEKQKKISYFFAFKAQYKEPATAALIMLDMIDSVIDHLVLQPMVDLAYPSLTRKSNLNYVEKELAGVLFSTLRQFRILERPNELELNNDSQKVESAEFSPDGASVVTISEDNTVRVWSKNGKSVKKYDKFKGKILRAALSPKGVRVLLALNDDTVRLVQDDGKDDGKDDPINFINFKGHSGKVLSAAFSPDGERFVTASQDGTARVWRADRQGEPVVLEGHRGHVLNAAFSPDGERVVTASSDGTARVWRAGGWNWWGSMVVLRGHKGAVKSAAFSPTGDRVVTASEDATARVWSSNGKGEPVVLEGHEGGLVDAVFSPDGARVATASEDGTARIWRADGRGSAHVLGKPVPKDSNEQEKREWSERRGMNSVAFSPTGAQVLTASNDGKARVWRTDGYILAPPLLKEEKPPSLVKAVFNSSGREVFTVSSDGVKREWWAGIAVNEVKLKVDRKEVVSAAFSPNGDRVVTATRDGTARVWGADGKGEPVMLIGHGDVVSSAAFSSDGHRVVTASYDNTARVWQADGEGEPVVLRGHKDRVLGADFSPDGARVVTVSRDRTARVWRANGKDEPVVLEGHDKEGHDEGHDKEGHDKEVLSAAFSPDGDRVVTASQDRTARVWRIADGRELLVLKGHERAVLSAAFSPDGKRVVTASQDHTARVWRIADGRELLVLKGHNAPVVSAAFSPDGEWVVTASADGTAGVWAVTAKSLKTVLRGLYSACLKPSLRVKYLLEELSEARANYIRCEQDHGRTPRLPDETESDD